MWPLIACDVRQGFYQALLTDVVQLSTATHMVTFTTTAHPGCAFAARALNMAPLPNLCARVFSCAICVTGRFEHLLSGVIDLCRAAEAWEESVRGLFAQKLAALQKKAGPTARKQILTPESLICIAGPCLSAERQTIEWLEVDADPTDAFAGVSWCGLETSDLSKT